MLRSFFPREGSCAGRTGQRSGYSLPGKVSVFPEAGAEAERHILAAADAVLLRTPVTSPDVQPVWRFATGLPLAPTQAQAAIFYLTTT